MYRLAQGKVKKSGDTLSTLGNDAETEEAQDKTPYTQSRTGFMAGNDLAARWVHMSGFRISLYQAGGFVIMRRILTNGMRQSKMVRKKRWRLALNMQGRFVCEHNRVSGCESNIVRSGQSVQERKAVQSGIVLFVDLDTLEVIESKG